MGLNSDKTSKVFFVLIFAVFVPNYIFFVPQWHSQPCFMKIVYVFDICTPSNQNVHFAVSSNDQIPRKRFCSRGIVWTRLTKSRPFAGELWHFEYFPTTTVRQLLIFDHMTHCCPNLLLYTKFHQNWFTRSASRRP